MLTKDKQWWMYIVLRLSMTKHGSLHGPLCWSPWSLLWLSIVCSTLIQSTFLSSQWLSVVSSLVIQSTCCGSMVPSVGLHSTFSSRFPWSFLQLSVLNSVVIYNTFCGSQWWLVLSVVFTVPSMVICCTFCGSHPQLSAGQAGFWLVDAPHHSQSDHWD